MSYLISLSTLVKTLRDMVYLEVHCREYLQMWHRFLKNWNGISLFYDTHLTVSSDTQLFDRLLRHISKSMVLFRVALSSSLI